MKQSLRQPQVSYSIIFVSDMEQSTSFYRDLIGFKLKFATPEWTEFDSEGATLALHRSETQPTESGGSMERPGSCRPGFQVSDLATFHQRMLENNVECVEEPARLFGAHIAQYRDPDGLVFSVGEAPR